jgi:hypothetical protein
LNGVIYHDVNWIAEVDYDDPNDYGPNEIEDEDEEYDDNKEDESKDQLKQYKQVGDQLKHIDPVKDQLEHIDPDEIKDIIQDARGNTNPNVHEPNNNANEEQLEHPVEQQQEKSARKST